MNNNMKDHKKIIKMLYRSFDEKLKEEEQIVLDAALAESPRLAAEKEKLEHLRLTVSQSSNESFKPFFAERVIQLIEGTPVGENTYDAFYKALSRVFRRMALTGSLMVAALFIYNISIGEAMTYNNIWILSDLNFQEFLGLPLF